MSRAELLELLEKHEVIVTFTKADGTVRKLRGTRKPDVFPKRVTKGGTLSPKQAAVMPIFDLEKNACRSFIINNILNMEVVQ